MDLKSICRLRHDGSVRRTAASILLASVAALGIALGSSPASAQTLQNKIWVRMVVFGQNDQPWSVPSEQGQDILNMIQTLQPDVLSRFFTGDPDNTITVPMGYGEPSMKLEDFMSAAMGAGAPGCTLTPKINLQDSFTYQSQAAKDLYNMQVTPQLQALDLDTYFSSGTAAQQQQQLQNIQSVGWPNIGFNFAGGPLKTYGVADYAYAAISKTNWLVNQTQLNDITSAGIPNRLAHIDYPQGITAFAQQSVDTQADEIQAIQQEQHKLNYTFIYPVLYSGQGYDASMLKTTSIGKYQGMTLLQIIAADIHCDRIYPTPCSVP